MPEQTTETAPAVETAQQPSTTAASAPTTEQAPAEGAAPSAEAAPTDELSASESAYARLLHADRGAAPEAEATAETAAEPEAAPAAQRKPAAAPSSGAFDAPGFTKSMVEQLGADSRPVAEAIAGKFSELFGRIDDLTAKLGEQSDSEGLKKLRQEFDPIARQINDWQQQTHRQEVSETHGWFNARAGYADRYGAADLGAHTPEQKLARMTVAEHAADFIAKSAARGRPLARPKALAMAEAIVFGEPTRAGATAAVQASVTRANRGISLDPARGSGTRPTETPEQERQRQVSEAERIEREARQKTAR